MRREGLVHHGIELQFDGERHRIPLSDLAGGRSIVIYGQTEVVKDLIAARLESGAPLLFEVDDVSRPRARDRAPALRFTHEGAATSSSATSSPAATASTASAGRRSRRRRCAPSSASIRSAGSGSSPPSRRRTTSSSTPTTSAGFALLSLRSPELSRLYLQCRPDEDIAEWPDERIWEELQTRLGLDGLDARRRARSSRRASPGCAASSPSRCSTGGLFLAGRRGAHRPADRREGPQPRDRRRARPRRGARRLVRDRQTARRLDGYSAACLRRVWRAEHFSWWMTSMLHRDDEAGEFDAAARSSRSSAT